MESRVALSSLPNQTYSVTIPGENRNITFIVTQSWNAQANYWVMGIYDKTVAPIVLGIPMLCGHDLLGQYAYLDIGSLYVENIGDPSIEEPDSENIGQNFELRWVLE